MNANTSTHAALSTAGRETSGRFAKNNPGGPGNPFARQTAALRAYLINHVTERDLQDILDILLLNAKGGHLPSIKFLFSYVIGKPQPAVNPDVLDMQELQLFQHGMLPPETLEALCRQLPLALLLQLVNASQTINHADTIREIEHDTAVSPAATAPPSTIGDNGSEHIAVTEHPPSANGENCGTEPAPRTKRRSPNGEKRHRPKVAGFDWLRDLRRLLH